MGMLLSTWSLDFKTNRSFPLKLCLHFSSLYLAIKQTGVKHILECLQQIPFHLVGTVIPVMSIQRDTLHLPQNKWLLNTWSTLKMQGWVVSKAEQCIWELYIYDNLKTNCLKLA